MKTVNIMSRNETLELINSELGKKTDYLNKEIDKLRERLIDIETLIVDRVNKR